MSSFSGISNHSISSSTKPDSIYHEKLNLDFLSEDLTSDEESAGVSSTSTGLRTNSINSTTSASNLSSNLLNSSRQYPTSRNSDDSLTSNSSSSSNSSTNSSSYTIPNYDLNFDDSSNSSNNIEDDEDEFQEKLSRGRSRSRSVHQYDQNFSTFSPTQEQTENIIPLPSSHLNSSSSGTSSLSSSSLSSSSTNINDKSTTSFLQPREINALQKGLEEATQSVNKYHTREDEEERMAADAEKRKRILPNSINSSNHSTNNTNLNTNSTLNLNNTNLLINSSNHSINNNINLNTSGLDPTRRIKILLLGDSGVGKSSLIIRWTIDTFSPNLHTTVGVNFKSKKLVYKNEILQVQVWDTAGQEQFHKITTSYYRGAQGIMLVYDVTDKKSLDNIEYWIKNIKTHASDNVHVVLVGNKNDLKNNSNLSNHVDNNHVKEIATKFSVPFFETSAKDNNHVEEAFMSLITEIVESNNNFNGINNNSSGYNSSSSASSNGNGNGGMNSNILNYSSGGLDRKISSNLLDSNTNCNNNSDINYNSNNEILEKNYKNKEKNKEKNKKDKKDKDCIIC